MNAKKNHTFCHFVNYGIATETRGILLRLSIAFLLTNCINVSLGEDKEPSIMVNNQKSQNENIYKVEQQREYFLNVSKLVDNAEADCTGANHTPIIAKLLDDVLSKDVVVCEVDLMDLQVMRRLAWFLISNKNTTSEDAQTNALLLCRYLGKIRNERIIDFTPKHVVVNVVPPAGVPGMAGMNPDAIADPVIRAEYEASIMENQVNNLLNSRQIALTKANNEMGKVIIAYIIRMVHDASLPHNVIRKCINDAELDDNEQKEVLAEITKVH